jgi:5-methylcytosine-specific restriction endonuclease McrA
MKIKRSNVVFVKRKSKRRKSKTMKLLLVPIQHSDIPKDRLFECHYCSKELTWNLVTVDHKIPLCTGGGNGPDNIVPSCHDCNNKKGNLPYEEFIKSIKISKIKKF